MAIPVLEVGTPLYNAIDLLDLKLQAFFHQMPGLEPIFNSYVDMVVFSPHAHEYNMLAAFMAGALTACLVIGRGRKGMAAEKSLKQYSP